MTTSVDFHFDPMCPFAYQTSLWIRDVRDQTGLEVTWRFFSLEEVNRVEGKKHPWEREWSYGWSLMRIGALLRRRDPALLDRWYAVIGRELHTLGGKPHDPEVARRLLTDIGVDAALLDQALGIRRRTTTCAPIISGCSTPAGTGCRRCSSTGSVCSARCWWIRRTGPTRCGCGT